MNEGAMKEKSEYLKPQHHKHWCQFFLTRPTSFELEKALEFKQGQLHEATGQ